MLNCAPNKHVMYFWMFAVCRSVGEVQPHFCVFSTFDRKFHSDRSICLYLPIVLCYAIGICQELKCCQN